MFRNKIKQNVLNISLSTVSHFIIDLYPAFIVGIIPLIAAKFNLSIFHVSIMTATSQISNSITQPIFGYLSDKNGHRNYMVYGLLSAAIFLSLIAIMPNYFLILILLFLGNLGVAAFHPPSAAIGAEYRGRKKGFGNSIIALGGNAGYAVGSLFFILIIDKIGIHYSPFAMIPGIIVAILLIKPMTEYDKKRKFLIFKLNEKKGKIEKAKFNKIKIAHISIVWIASLARDTIWIALLTFMPLHFSNLKINIINISFILLAFGIVGGIGGVFSSYFTDRIKRKTLIQIALIAIIPLIFFTFKTNNILSIILFILTGFFLISTVPLGISLSQEIFPKNLSLASSLVMGFSAGFAGIIVMFLGKLADKIGIEMTVYFILILPIIGFLAMFFLPYFENKKIYN